MNVITGKIVANKNVWIIGDVFLTDVVAVLTQMQGLEKDQLYVYQAYDVQVFYAKKQCTDTFGKQIRTTLYQALSQNNRLPAVLLVVTGNTKIDNMVTTPYHTKRVWNTLLTEIDRAIKARKNDLPRKAFLNDEPRVFFTNVYPRYKDHCERVDEGFDSFKTKRRRINNILPQVAAKFSFEVLSINGILPDNADFFELSTGKLSGKGMREYWVSVSKELKLADETVKDRIRNDIIKSYLDDRKHKERVQEQRNDLRAERNSFDTRYTLSKRNDRGDYKRDKIPFRRNTGNKSRFFRGHSATR